MQKEYKIIKTEDGSNTVYSPLYDEACHSTSGAIDETRAHYLEGCKIKDLDRPVILEVGFGTGLGFIETLKYCDIYFEFISLEIDENMIQIAMSNYPELKELKKIDNTYTLKTDNYSLTILLGDARETLRPHLESLKFSGFNAIYQDAFSPKRNPVLWTTEWFTLLKEYSQDNCTMSTYSSSSSIRKSMIAAGWKLYSGVKFGTKRASTRARMTGETETKILEHLERSPVITLTDENAKDYKL